MSITLAEAKAISTGTTLYHAKNRNADGTPQRWRVTSVKTWKTRPDAVRIGVKHGLRNYDTITEGELGYVCLTEEEAMGTDRRVYQVIRWYGYRGEDGPKVIATDANPAALLAAIFHAMGPGVYPTEDSKVIYTQFLGQMEDGYWDLFVMPWGRDQMLGNDAAWEHMAYEEVDLLFSPSVRAAALTLLLAKLDSEGPANG